MKPNAAAPGTKDRRSEQMIQVHQHGRQQDQPVFLTVRLIVPVSNSANEDEVEEVMNNCLQQWFKV